MEQNIIINLQKNGNIFWDIFFQIQSNIASWVGVLCLFLVIILFINKKFGIFFGYGFLVTIGFNYLLKVIVNRPRPFEANSQIINKLSTIGKSFPSGHMVSATFMVLSILFLLYMLNKSGKLNVLSKTWCKILVITLGVIFVILTGIARLYLGQHYITDLLGGVIVAFIGFFITAVMYKKLDKTTFKE